MLVLMVLFVAWLVFRGLGAAGIAVFAAWHNSAAYALAVLFVFTGIAHFNRMKHDLARMVPHPFPAMVMVYLTGVCEFLGALGLAIPSVRRYAAIALIAMLVCLLPANIKASLQGLTLRGKVATPLWLRIPMQVLFIGLLWWVR